MHIETTLINEHRILDIETDFDTSGIYEVNHVLY